MYAGTRSMFEEMNRLRQELDTVLGGEFGPRWNLPFSRYSFLPGRSARSYPLMNVVERPDSFEVEALAPGLEPSNLELSFSDRTLSITGEKSAIGDETSKERVHRLERSGGRFHRTLRLEQDVDRDAIQAAYRDGILKITLPKAESARPRTIEVEVG